MSDLSFAISVTILLVATATLITALGIYWFLSREADKRSLLEFLKYVDMAVDLAFDYSRESLLPELKTDAPNERKHRHFQLLEVRNLITLGLVGRRPDVQKIILECYKKYSQISAAGTGESPLQPQEVIELATEIKSACTKLLSGYTFKHYLLQLFQSGN